jgi:hypothetical protein
MLEHPVEFDSITERWLLHEQHFEPLHLGLEVLYPPAQRWPAGDQLKE